MYDVGIIGGGPGGYTAAERLGAAGKKVLLVEDRPTLGGACLNEGCIPTKALINSAKQFSHAKQASQFGVTVTGASYDWKTMQSWKARVVRRLCAGVAASEKRYGVEVLQGHAEIVEAAQGSVKIKITRANNEGRTEDCRAVLVCTGAAPVTLPVPGVQDNPALLDSKGMLALDHVPEKLVVIGGGVIGIEFAGLFSALGTQVTVIEMTDEIIPNMDRELAPLYRKALAPVVFKLGCKVERLEGGTVFYTTSDGKEESTAGDTVLMAAGRRPVLQGWGAEKTGMVVTRKGVTVDGHMRTNVQGIWAAGDVTGLACLAHAAYRQAEIAAADIITTLDDRPETTNVWRGCVPWVVYGLTEAAGVGLTEQDAEQEAEKQGLELVKKTLPMSYSGRFMAENSPTAPGAMKVLADAKTRRILGIHAVGPYASEFIGGLGALIEMECKVEDVRQLIFPHPTVSELLRDCVWEM